MDFKIKFISYIVCGLLFPIIPNMAQVPETGNWFIYFGNQNFANNKWVWHNEFQHRNFNFAGNREQLLLRTGLGHYLTEGNHLVSIGYAYIHTRPLKMVGEILDVDEANAFSEHRIWQQYWSRQTAGRFVLIHRYRFEQRFFENDVFRKRLRYFIGLNVPINKQRMGDNTFYFSAYNEVFINTREEGIALFDRNRLYGALGYQTSPKLRFEFGMMRQSTNNANFSRTQLQLVVFNNLPFQ